MTQFITRVAPAPSGNFHVGTARTAYFNWLLAKATGGEFILRIDDTDDARNDEAYVDVIKDAMDWLGLDYSTSFRQSSRRASHVDHAKALVDKGLARMDGDAIRLNLADDLPTTWVDEISGTIKVTDNDRKLVGDLVLVRSDGHPTYHLSSIIDDVTSGVNYIARGTDHTSNTIKQIAIARAVFGAEKIDAMKFAHLGLIEIVVDGKRKKLSKRDEAASLLKFRDDGVSPEAMLNFLLRLGWSPSDANFDKHTKMITKDMAIELFMTGGKMKNSPVLFDPMKLASYNRAYSH